MVKNWEINGTEETGLVTPTPVQVFDVSYLEMAMSYWNYDRIHLKT